jgi:hypothetical protein
MRFGIELPAAGVLSEPAALSATAAAADQLGYAAVWSPWLGELAQVAAVTRSLALGWILDESPGTTPLRPGGLGSWAGLLTAVVAPRTAFGRVRPMLPTAVLLDSSTEPPPADEGTGWAPSGYPGAGALERWRTANPDARLVLRWDRELTAAEIEDVRSLDVDEVVVRAPGATTLDEQLATFARVAEALAQG